MGENLCGGWCAARVAAAVEAIMRRLVCGLLLAGVVAPAVAGDNSWLRGSTTDFPTPHPYARWAGLYGGGQMGADFHGIDFRASTGAAIGNIMAQDAILARLPVTQLPQSPVFVKSGPSFGGFLGYNYQIDDVVLGVEANFNWSSVNASGSEFRTRSYVVVFNGHTYAPLTVNVTDGAKIVLNDYGSLRVRGAWAYGNFLPYVLAGVTLAQIDTSRSVTVSYAGTDVTPQVAPGNPGFIPVGATYDQGDRSHGKYIFGFSAGLGIDYALASNFFLRGEVEYLQLGSPNDIKLNTTSIRTGMGLKF
jgi:outer membrane immunogenic protein